MTVQVSRRTAVVSGTLAYKMRRHRAAHDGELLAFPSVTPRVRRVERIFWEKANGGVGALFPESVASDDRCLGCAQTRISVGRVGQ